MKRYYIMNCVSRAYKLSGNLLCQLCGVEMKLGFRADLIVEDLVLIEIKSLKTLELVHKKQLMTYLKLTGFKLGLLVNFNEALIKNGIVRIVNNL
jgi:GxxExxY protein